MKNYNTFIESSSSSDPPISEMEKFAQILMQFKGSSTICELVSREIEKEFGLPQVKVAVFNNGDVFSTFHYCNMSNNSPYLYDFTGDQFVGNSKFSKVWIYCKAANSEIYVSKGGYTSAALSAKYPTRESVFNSHQDDLFGIEIQ